MKDGGGTWSIECRGYDEDLGGHALRPFVLVVDENTKMSNVQRRGSPLSARLRVCVCDEFNGGGWVREFVLYTAVFAIVCNRPFFIYIYLQHTEFTSVIYNIYIGVSTSRWERTPRSSPAAPARIRIAEFHLYLAACESLCKRIKREERSKTAAVQQLFPVVYTPSLFSLLRKLNFPDRSLWIFTAAGDGIRSCSLWCVRRSARLSVHTGLVVCTSWYGYVHVHITAHQ